MIEQLRRRFAGAIPAALAVALVACTGAAPAQSAPPSTPPPTEPPVADFPEASWRVVRLGGAQVGPVPAITVTFSGGSEVRGSGGCNTYGGRYGVEGERILIENVASTMMACLDDGAMQREGAYLAAIGQVRSWALVDGTLVLRDAQGRDRLVLEREA